MEVVKNSKNNLLFTVIPKNQWVYFVILTIGLTIALVQAIKYCDSPIWTNMPVYFIKPQNADMLIYNLSVSYIVSYMFYLLVNFIPDCVRAVNKEKSMLPFRATIQREVQEFVSGIINLWVDVGVYSTNENIYKIVNTSGIENFLMLMI